MGNPKYRDRIAPLPEAPRIASPHDDEQRARMFGQRIISIAFHPMQAVGRMLDQLSIGMGIDNPNHHNGSIDNKPTSREQ